MIKKFLKYTLIFLVVVATCFFLYLRFGGYFFIDKEYKEYIVAEIDAAPELSEKFYELYELAYPNSLSKGVLSNVIENQIFGNRNSESPTLSTSAMITCSMERYLLAFYLQDQTTPRQCLNYNAEECDFLQNNIGIENASRFYFEKKLADLEDEEMLALIIMMKNPSYYNPIRRPEKVIEKVNSILERRENKKKSRNLMQLFNIL